MSYETIPLFEIDPNMDEQMQCNVSDLAYGVFFSPTSVFVQAQGSIFSDLKRLCLEAITDTITKMEAEGRYVLTSVSLTKFFQNGPKITVAIRATTDTEVMDKTVIIRR